MATPPAECNRHPAFSQPSSFFTSWGRGCGLSGAKVTTCACPGAGNRTITTARCDMSSLLWSPIGLALQLRRPLPDDIPGPQRAARLAVRLLRHLDGPHMAPVEDELGRREHAGRAHEAGQEVQHLGH